MRLTLRSGDHALVARLDSEGKVGGLGSNLKGHIVKVLAKGIEQGGILCTFKHPVSQRFLDATLPVELLEKVILSYDAVYYRVRGGAMSVWFAKGMTLVADLHQFTSTTPGKPTAWQEVECCVTGDTTGEVKLFGRPFVAKQVEVEPRLFKK